jgi:hypothetical protein
MNIAESAADWVLTDSPPRYPPPGLGGARIPRNEVHYQTQQPEIYDPTQVADMNAYAPEWVPPAVARQSFLDFSIDEAKRNLTHAFACARQATKIAEDATIAAKIATDAAISASESVEKAATNLRDLQRIYSYHAQEMPVIAARAVPTSLARPIPAHTVHTVPIAVARPIPAHVARAIPAATVRAIYAAPHVIPAAASKQTISAAPKHAISAATKHAISAAARPMPASSGGSTALSASPIVAPVKLRRGTKDCFEKQEGRPCKPNNGKPCKWCK